ncbi:3'5'-cyclic nucleotide phosphodiesterase family protein [Tritrichomonas foetus]|uniref:3'5'-cyclic nucleotide phosphodiesterase family protein n=1 Tax=Tritrichomonas foetus TaxID=1144522 RepID=A0A1J4L3H1_9EUKA|nr:3'5'-cyclic nucleotide phosphodiesterase family protein [Tritrichomonas foetus]|eukprot:OHT17624.1 3'5'-cyclic nucleotide phosphodiesterase family protein [Tritrichomonas foetus]
MSASKSRLRTATGGRPHSTLNGEKIKTSHGVRKLKIPSAPIEQLRNVAKTNQETAAYIANLESEREVLFERIQALQEHLIRDQDVIGGLKSKISQLTMGASSFTSTLTTSHPVDYGATSGNASVITPANCVDFLRNRPMILAYFLGFDEDFLDFSCSVNKTVQPLFFGYSSRQLNRIAECFSLFQELSSNIQRLEFIPTCVAKVQKIFMTNSVLNLIRDPKSGKFECLIDGKEMHYEITEQTSSVAHALEKQEVFVQNQNSLSESLHLDVIFNPNCNPSIIIPIGNDATLYIISQKTGKYNSYSPEDQIVAIFLSYLLKPLYNEHLKFLNLMKEVELRRNICTFEKSLLSKSNFSLLLPFLFSVINSYTGANDADIFIVGEDSFYSFDVVEGRLKKKQYPFTGIPKLIVETKKQFVTDRLNSHECKEFDSAIDMWSLNKCYAGFPIIVDNNVVAVLCMIDKIASNSFTGWDIDFLYSISSSLAVVLPQCLESSGENVTNLSMTNLKTFTNLISNISKEKMNEKDALSILSKPLYDLFKFEWFAIYTKNQRDIVKRLVSLHNGENYDKSVLNDESAINIFNLDSLIVASDIIQIVALVKPDIPIAQTMLIAHNEKVAIVAFNICSLDEVHKSLFTASLSIISDAIEIDAMKEEIVDNRNAGTSLRNVLDVTTTAIQSEDPFLSILTMLCDLITMNTFSLFQYDKKSQNYQMFMVGKDTRPVQVSADDSLIDYASGLDEPVLIEKFASSNYGASKILHIFPFFTHVLVVPFDKANNVFAVFVGESITLNYDTLLNYFYPIILCFYKNYVLLNQKAISPYSTSEFFNSKLLDSEISARLFSVTNLTETQCIEVVVKMFQNLDLLAAMQTDSEAIAETALAIRSAYNNLPFHNWLHAIDTTQFVYSCLIRGRMRRYFSPLQMAALLLGSLCHDVGHTGVNTTFHVKTKSNIYFAFGEQSPLERYHATIAAKVLEQSPIFPGIDTASFWKFFINIIVATDMVRHFEFLESFKGIVDRFEYGKELHRLILAQFLVKCGNVANTTRPFDVALFFGKALLEEYQNQTDQEKEVNVELTKFGDTDGMPLWEIEIAFYTGIVSPMLKLLSRMTPDLNDFNIQMEDNKMQWGDYGRRQTQNQS